MGWVELWQVRVQTGPNWLQILQKVPKQHYKNFRFGNNLLRLRPPLRPHFFFAPMRRLTPQYYPEVFRFKFWSTLGGQTKLQNFLVGNSLLRLRPPKFLLRPHFFFLHQCIDWPHISIQKCFRFEYRSTLVGQTDHRKFLGFRLGIACSGYDPPHFCYEPSFCWSNAYIDPSLLSRSF